MGLRFADDLAAWERWVDSRHRVRRLRSRLSTPPAQPDIHAAQRGDNPRVVVGLDSRTTSTISSLGVALRGLDSVAVFSSVHTAEQVRAMLEVVQPCAGKVRDVPADTLPDSAAVVLTSGHFLACGGLLWRLAQEHRVPYAVVQHGLMTPFAPPLPHGCHLLAFSDADAGFWMSGRDDITPHTVGSQLLWEAARTRADPVDEAARPVFLGQLHGAELPRMRMAQATTRFWRETRCVYRPHPSEVDILSRLQHRAWAAAGMRIDTAPRPLRELDAPVVAAFSTGILEAAAHGLPSWAYFPHPPRWLAELWERYDIRRWGSPDGPTPPPTPSPVAPAQRIAEAALQIAEEAS